MQKQLWIVQSYIHEYFLILVVKLIIYFELHYRLTNGLSNQVIKSLLNK